MKNLYRRYRPIKLEDVIGQPQVTDPLTKSLRANKISHAYLFIGPRGTGKTSVARIFAHEVNGFEYKLEDNYVDIIEIDGASNRGIDNIRELREKATIAPTSGKYKIYIIDEVHMLTKEAFNALLKTLEEPPEHVIFIMATTDAYKVPVTITSRAQTYMFKLADENTMLTHLRKIAKADNIKINDEALKIIARRGGGSFRDSLSLLDQISTLSDKEITKDAVISAMGLPEDEKIAELLKEYIGGDVVKITTVLKDLLSSGIKPETLAEEMIDKIISDPKPELLPLLAKLPEIKAPFPEAKLLVALTLNKKVITGETAGRTAIPHKIDNPAPSPDSTLTSQQNIQQNDKPDAQFDWDAFTNKVQEMNDAIYSQLLKTSHRMLGEVLHIYPNRKIVKTILSRDNNKRILAEASGGVKIEIHEVGEAPSGTKKDEVLSRISDIMGGEIENDGGGNPFEE